MSYAHIENLYKNQTILMFRECYATEKIHGSSAHVAWKDGKLTLFAGGESAERFAALFSRETLTEGFTALGHDEVTVYGEVYGGRCQGMSATYGKELRFIAFEVQIGEAWLSVENAVDVATKLGIEFVHYRKISTDLTAIDAERDADSVQAVRNGMGPGHKREGIVLHPLQEFRDQRGDRVIAKHKRDEFKETATPREVDPAKAKTLADAEAIALEWVTDMRLTHVLDKLPGPHCPEQTGMVIKAMTEDVMREGAGEFVDTKDARRAIGSRTAAMFKKRLASALKDPA